MIFIRLNFTRNIVCLSDLNLCTLCRNQHIQESVLNYFQINTLLKIADFPFHEIQKKTDPKSKLEMSVRYLSIKRCTI